MADPSGENWTSSTSSANEQFRLLSNSNSSSSVVVFGGSPETLIRYVIVIF